MCDMRRSRYASRILFYDFHQVNPMPVYSVRVNTADANYVRLGENIDTPAFSHIWPASGWLSHVNRIWAEAPFGRRRTFYRELTQRCVCVYVCDVNGGNSHTLNRVADVYSIIKYV